MAGMRLPGLLVASCLWAACGGGGSSSPIAGADVPPELIACRARVDDPFRFAEIAVRNARNLGLRRVSDRSGIERSARVHQDGNTVVFARERQNGDPNSLELFTSTLDGSRAELRLTQNTVRDDDPCWSPDGLRILFASERAGQRGLWSMAANGDAPTQFVVTPTASADKAPDWNAASDRVVWSRRGADGRFQLWLASGAGTGAMQLTDAGITLGADNGDEAPAFATNGQDVVFVRRYAPTQAVLCLCNVATSAVTVLLTPNGDVVSPRIAAARDRVFFGLAEPVAGRATLRLATIPFAGGAPTLVWPDERWRLEGLDLLPSLPAPATGAAPQRLDVTRAQLQIATASSANGSRSQLATADGDEYIVTTTTIAGREVAGINVVFDLPVTTATDVLELQVTLVARSTRSGGDSLLRSSIYNPLDERFDTVVEIPAATSATTLTFATSSLRHVTSEKQLRVTVIADLAPGPRADLRIDLVEVVMIARRP